MSFAPIFWAPRMVCFLATLESLKGIAWVSALDGQPGGTCLLSVSTCSVPLPHQLIRLVPSPTWVTVDTSPGFPISAHGLMSSLLGDSNWPFALVREADSICKEIEGFIKVARDSRGIKHLHDYWFYLENYMFLETIQSTGSGPRPTFHISKKEFLKYWN